ncbi:MAG: HAD-IIIC family phosphatase [Peptococcaceae bacterium]|jgi:FkbH-like protein|nr:HAD-IIIC family phosphatase [Peptococcaceae bacterium]
MRISSIPPDDLHRKNKAIKRELLAANTAWLDKRVAVLGGSTTDSIIKMLDLYLLNHGIRAVFYESEYAQYWQDAMFPNAALAAFEPDMIFIHTSNRNITRYPALTDSVDAVDALLNVEYDRFVAMWDKLTADYHCPIIQNNFEYPFWRLMGNRDGSDIHGRVNFVARLNLKFAEYAQTHDHFYINDINWLSADYGLEAWSDPFYWHMYKYALAMPAIPRLAQSVANIIKSLCGKNKKAFALDLDDTLWGGIVGDDGAENLQVGQETPVGQAYSEFQEYIKAHKQLGVILNVVSKNATEAALAGLNRPDMTLTPEDFILIKANWEPKSQNLADIAHTLALLPESFVFVDDNPAEREIVRREIPEAAAPEIGEKPEHYIRAIDREGYFEATSLTADDHKRVAQYKDNAARSKLETTFTDYGAYLRSLEMTAEIQPFAPMYMSRVAQLTNKSNQFNLTTRRYTQAEIEAAAADPRYITLYGRLSDKFGDNGVVAVAIGETDGGVCHIVLWLMSCRVLKRDMEFAMMDELARRCKERGVTTIKGYYYPTAKNGMVRGFYEGQGFTLDGADGSGAKTYSLNIEDGYENKNQYIQVNP